MQSLPSLSTPSSLLFPQNTNRRSHYKDASSSTTEPAMKIFICYAREDEGLRQQLEKRLKGLRRQGLITIWHDRRISPGAEWEHEIDAHLNEAQIVLLLVSPDFIDSDYCYGIEMKRALEKHNRKEATVIPIILRYVHWEWTPFGKLQALPKDAKPVCSWPDPDEAFFNVTDGIRIAVEEEAHRIREGRER
jgi:TIR domain